ncbi:hypothetical protein B296_00057773 [Ensete ventricosum]|uniref:Uncharacterized protein n=1 Tax=Ensete ventricosum TaxID=4639 RepID=A0A426X1B5_ENSVE|nr:hypothetical protein B296_00057773 [Ensete ventricosum]
MGFYSKAYEAFVLEVLTAPVAYHVIILRRNLYGPCDEGRGVLPAIGERRSFPPYPCQFGRTTTDPPMLVLGRLQSRRVGHVVGPTVRGRRDMAARSTFVMSCQVVARVGWGDLRCKSWRFGRGMISGANLGDLAEGPISGTNPGDLAERVISGTNLGDLAERVISGTNPRDLAERVISGTNLGDLTEGPISGINPGDLVERVISSTNLGDLAEEPISGTNPGDLVERVISGTNPGDLAEGPISSTNPGDLAEGLLYPGRIRVACSVTGAAPLQFIRAWYVHLCGCSRGRSPVSPASPYKRVP